MAESMLDIRRHMRSITSTEHITNAMKLVSASKFKKAKDIFDKTSRHISYLLDTIDDILVHSQDLPDLYTYKGEEFIESTCYIVITSSRGLCGSFNGNVIKKVEEEMQESPEDVPHFFTIGTKGRDYFKSRGFDIAGEWEENPESITFEKAMEICSFILDRYKQGDYDEVVVVYTSFVNSLVQEPVARRLVPFNREIDYGKVAYEEIEYDPSPEEVFKYLVPKFFEMALFEAIVESATCEHIARRNAMDKATDNANDMIRQLDFKYNRARQSSITNELIEIVAGAEALK